MASRTTRPRYYICVLILLLPMCSQVCDLSEALCGVANDAVVCAGREREREREEEREREREREREEERARERREREMLQEVVEKQKA